MNENEINRVVSLHYWIAIILVGVCFWDIFVLQVSSWPFYYPFKIVVISVFLLSAILIKRRKLSTINGMDISCYTLYVYGFIGTNYLHSTYIFSFYEGLFIICFFYHGPLLRYTLLTLFGLLLTSVSIHYMPEPDFIKEGHSIRPHLQTATVIIGILSFVVYWFFNRQKELIYKMDQKFASIGRQSAFLLHELKSPLNRFMVRNSDKNNRDAEYILSIVEGVELLISGKENLAFKKFDWNDIKSYLEDEFHEVCKHYQIKLEIIGLEGEGLGHRSAIKLALKNLIKNAVESIVMENIAGLIRVKRDKDIIEVTDNGSPIAQEQIGQLFKPFYSKKSNSTNYGIGLHFVDSVVKAHEGSIMVAVVDDWNVFKLTLGSNK